MYELLRRFLILAPVDLGLKYRQVSKRNHQSLNCLPASSPILASNSSSSVMIEAVTRLLILSGNRKLVEV